MKGLATPLKDPKAHITIQMLESEKSLLKNLQMQRSMPPRLRVNSQNEAALPSLKGNITWVIIYAFIAANQGIKP
jgi:hypothetical protein